MTLESGKYCLKYFYCIVLQYSNKYTKPLHVYLERSERSIKYKTETVYKCMLNTDKTSNIVASIKCIRYFA